MLGAQRISRTPAARSRAGRRLPARWPAPRPPLAPRAYLAHAGPRAVAAASAGPEGAQQRAHRRRPAKAPPPRPRIPAGGQLREASTGQPSAAQGPGCGRAGGRGGGGAEPGLRGGRGRGRGGAAAARPALHLAEAAVTRPIPGSLCAAARNAGPQCQGALDTLKSRARGGPPA